MNWLLMDLNNNEKLPKVLGFLSYLNIMFQQNNPQTETSKNAIYILELFNKVS